MGLPRVSKNVVRTSKKERMRSVPSTMEMDCIFSNVQVLSALYISRKWVIVASELLFPKMSTAVAAQFSADAYWA